MWLCCSLDWPPGWREQAARRHPSCEDVNWVPRSGHDAVCLHWQLCICRHDFRTCGLSWHARARDWSQVQDAVVASGRPDAPHFVARVHKLATRASIKAYLGLLRQVCGQYRYSTQAVQLWYSCGTCAVQHNVLKRTPPPHPCARLGRTCVQPKRAPVRQTPV